MVHEVNKPATPLPFWCSSEVSWTPADTIPELHPASGRYFFAAREGMKFSVAHTSSGLVPSLTRRCNTVDYLDAFGRKFSKAMTCDMLRLETNAIRWPSGWIEIFPIARLVIPMS